VTVPLRTEREHRPGQINTGNKVRRGTARKWREGRGGGGVERGYGGNKEESCKDINKNEGHQKKTEWIGVAVMFHTRNLKTFDSNLSGDTYVIVEIISGFPYYLQLQSWKSVPELLDFWAVPVVQNSKY
jgi:hypothetical protein